MNTKWDESIGHSSKQAADFPNYKLRQESPVILKGVVKPIRDESSTVGRDSARQVNSVYMDSREERPINDSRSVPLRKKSNNRK